MAIEDFFNHTCNIFHMKGFYSSARAAEGIGCQIKADPPN